MVIGPLRGLEGRSGRMPWERGAVFSACPSPALGLVIVVRSFV